MQTQKAMQTTQPQTPSGPILTEAEKLFEQMKEFSQSVARRAYEFFETRGRELGHDLEDWFRAETELMRRTPMEIREAENRITVRAEVPGFTANEIKVCVQPKWLVISGKSEKTAEEKKEEKTVFSELRSNQFCRELALPAEVDPAKTTATLKDGVLELVLAKAAESKAVDVEVKTE